tara:strand:+ start:1148 stop:1408 length:261 start_codon:yes stop_codon:yes gene_type:complete
MLIKKNDIVRRVKRNESSFYNEMEIGSIGLVIKGPYEKNISDILYNSKPWLAKQIRYSEIKMVVDILSEKKMHKYCVVEEYERVKK